MPYNRLSLEYSTQYYKKQNKGISESSLVSFFTNNFCVELVRIVIFTFLEKLIIRGVFGVKIRPIVNRKSLSKAPVIYIANHASHLDTPAIISSLPLNQRRNLAVAAAEDHFFNKWKTFLLVTSIVNIIPISRRRFCKNNIKNMKSLLNKGKSILLYPEGSRTRNGKMMPFKNGIGLIVKEMNVPVIPIKIDNAYNLFNYAQKFPKQGEVTVSFGEAIKFNGLSGEEIVGKCEEAVRSI